MLKITQLEAAHCRYLVKERRYCGATKKPGSSYCHVHHMLCYIPAPKSMPAPMKNPCSRRRRLEVA